MKPLLVFSLIRVVIGLLKQSIAVETDRQQTSAAVTWTLSLTFDVQLEGMGTHSRGQRFSQRLLSNRFCCFSSVCSCNDVGRYDRLIYDECEIHAGREGASRRLTL